MANDDFSGDIRKTMERARALKDDAEHLVAKAHAITERLHGLEDSARSWQHEAQALINSARGRLDQLAAH